MGGDFSEKRVPRRRVLGGGYWTRRRGKLCAATRKLFAQTLGADVLNLWRIYGALTVRLHPMIKFSKIYQVSAGWDQVRPHSCII